jgi:DNA modification methylase
VSYRIELGDCHEEIKALPDNSVDAVIADPPYHTTQLAFDKLEVRWHELWEQIYRVCKPNAVQVMFSAQPFTTDLINSNRARFRYELIWPKTTSVGFLNAENRPLKNHENVLLFAERLKESVYNPQMWRSRAYGVVKRSPVEMRHYGQQAVSQKVNEGERYPLTVLPYFAGQQANADHPTQKPLDLLCYLVKTYTNPGDTLLDCFMGSGTTGHACLLLGRSFIGYELSPEYFATAKRRLEAAAAQPRIFEVA